MIWAVILCLYLYVFILIYPGQNLTLDLYMPYETISLSDDVANYNCHDFFNIKNDMNDEKTHL